MYYCLTFWFGGTQIQSGNTTFQDMNRVSAACSACPVHLMLLLVGLLPLAVQHGTANPSPFPPVICYLCLCSPTTSCCTSQWAWPLQALG